MKDLVEFNQHNRSPEAVTQGLAVSLPPAVRSLLSDPVNRDYVDPTYGWDGWVSAYSLPATIEANSHELAVALADIDEVSKPLPDERIVLEINKLKVRCKMRSEQQEDLQMLIACMLDDLQDYPADIVIDVLKRWPRISPWWPSWNELYERLERQAAPRSAMRQAIATALEKVRDAD